ncbi:MAG: hypothetical protein AAF708_11600 [Deinococcota bacterium]
MTLREQIQARIAELDDAVLPDVMRELDLLEERLNREFPQDFVDMMNRPKDNGLSGEEALAIATEAVKADRRKHR